MLQLMFFDGDSYAAFLMKDAIAPNGEIDLIKAVRPLTLEDHWDIAGLMPDWSSDGGDAYRRMSLVHYLTRNTMVLASEADQKVRAVYNIWSSRCLQRGLHLAGPDFQFADLPVPAWATRTAARIRQQLRHRYPKVDDIRLTTTLDLRLHARSYPHRSEIEVSVLTREFLRGINLAIWNYVDLTRRDSANQDNRDGDAALPFLMAITLLYRDISISGLPTIRALNEFTFMGALNTTGLQLEFMLAHEFAHMLLHADMTNLEIKEELEADDFAYRMLFDNPGDNILVGDVWTAGRWLFAFHRLEGLIGDFLCGIPNSGATGLQRRARLVDAYARAWDIAPQDILLESIGTGLLDRIHDRLQADGSESVVQAVNTISKLEVVQWPPGRSSTTRAHPS